MEQRGQYDTDVIVVGAGPVGLTVAIALRRLGLRIRVVDRASGANREPRADVIFPRAGEALDALGVGETIRRHSFEMMGAEFFGDGRRMGSFRSGRFASRYPRAMTIEQHDIERLLGTELAEHDVHVQWHIEISGLRDRGSHVELTLTQPDGRTEVATTAWVVACDGKHSTVRGLLGVEFEGRRRDDLQILQGNVVPSWPLPYQPGHGYFFLAPYRTVLAFPIPDGGYRVFIVRDDPDPDHMDPPTLEELRELVAGAAGLPDLQLSLTEPVWLNRVRVADRVATRLRQGRVLLAGDAAHAWAPIGGHGMNVGMLGAHNLAWKLAAVHRGQAADALLDSYDAEQRAFAFGVMRDMRLNITEVLLPRTLHRLRCAFLRATMSAESVQRRTEWMMSDFGRNHRRSDLSWHRAGRRGRGPRAGDRIPDIPVVTPGDDQAVNLHHLLGYDRWTLLLAGPPTAPATLQKLRDTIADTTVRVEIVPIAPADASAARQLGQGSEILLVRPDGYIGLVAPLEPIYVRDYLATFGFPCTDLARPSPQLTTPRAVPALLRRKRLLKRPATARSLSRHVVGRPMVVGAGSIDQEVDRRGRGSTPTR